MTSSGFCRCSAWAYSIEYSRINKTKHLLGVTKAEFQHLSENQDLKVVSTENSTDLSKTWKFSMPALNH